LTVSTDIVDTLRVVATFRAATDAHGIPASTLTDNGLVFTTRFLHGPNGFERRKGQHPEHEWAM
jgi:hypothetical protein